MTVSQVASLADLQQKLVSADANRLFVLDFYADWCGPCKFIAPVFEQLSQRFTNATFLKVNVDYAQDISQQYAVRAMPTFVLIKSNNEVGRIQGANQQALEQAIHNHYSSTPANPNSASATERQFLQQFVKQTERIRDYEDVVYRTLALSVLPEDRLKAEATVDGKLSMNLLAKGLLEWFKGEFFTWCDSPKCDYCGVQTTKGAGLNGTPTPKEIEDGASRVEIFICQCGREVRFPRYNTPAKLLETRTGRCGEWANCFCLIAAAVGFDVRFVYDVTDHVWCELWLPEMDRWVHCDPCENSLDAPLLYEKGWNKKLSYVVAIGLDHIYDVTWRYSDKHHATLKRRTFVRELVLSNFLKKLNDRLMSTASADRKTELSRRRMRELIEFIQIGPRKNVGKLGGRTTGDVAWRAARGELGSTGASPKKKQQIVLRPSDAELAEKRMSVRYNCSSDMYTRGENHVRGWASYVYRSKDVMRKTENDWKMAYLCRKETKQEGEISWAIDLTGVKAKYARVQMKGIQTYHGADLFISACADEVCMRVPDSGELVIEDPPSALLKITANFAGGDGENAFQHSQLFRTSLDAPEDQLVIEIEFV